MNFDLSDEQQVLGGLAQQIFGDLSTIERITELQTRDGFDATLWSELAKAGLLGLCVAEEHGGLAMHMVELSLVLEQQGRYIAQVPLWSSSIAAMTVAEFASQELQNQVLPGVCAGTTILSTALANFGANDSMNPSVEAIDVIETKEGGIRLIGSKPAVPYAQHAHYVVVSAKRANGSIVLALVDTDARGVTITPVEGSDRQPQANMEIDVVVPTSHVISGLTSDGREALRWMHEHSLVALCAIQLGVAQGSIAITAEHVKTRHQFGKPLSAQQAVAVRAADAYITTEAMRVTTLNAAWQLAEGFDARQDVLVAMYWATEGGHSVVLAGQHLHGGVGADISYPVHRFFLWGIQISTQLGGASQHLARLGKLIASK